MNALAKAADPIAVSTLQQGLERFETSKGHVAYVRVNGIALTLGAPVCALEDMREVAQQFLAAVPEASFFYVTEQQREAMQLPMPSAFPVGVDTVLPLPLAHIPEQASSARRKAEKSKVTLTERTGALEGLGEKLREVQSAYLGRREVKAELKFLNRPCEFENETLGRTFVLEHKGALLGFIVIDPYTTASGGQGHLLNMFRLAPTKLWNVYQAAVLMLAERLTAEGCTELSLGFVPFAPSAEPLPWWLRIQKAALTWLTQKSPYLRRLATIKHGFAAQPVTRYLISPRRLMLRDFRAFLTAMGAYA